MAKLPLDFSKFKKVASDKHTTTLQHYQGHEIKIMHSKLSTKMREHLSALPVAEKKGAEKDKPKQREQKMAEGGPVDNSKKTVGQIIGYPGSSPTPSPAPKDQKMADGGIADNSVPEPDPKKAKQMQDSAMSTDWDPSVWVKNIKEGLSPQPSPSPTKNYESGGVASNAQDSPAQIAADAANGQQPQQSPVSITINSGGASQQMPPQSQASSGMAQAYGQAMGVNPVPQPSQPVAVPPDAQGAAYAQANNEKFAPPAPAPRAAPQMAAPTQAPATPQQPGANDPFGTQAYYDNFQQGLGEQKRGIVGEARAVGAQGKAEAEQLQKSINDQQDNINNYQSHYKALEDERMHVSNDIDMQHIDPNHFWNSKDTGGKIAATIGLILGGFGGVAGQGNMAASFLDKLIANDIDAQKANLAKNENLLSANLKQFGNLRDATDMTRVMQMDRISNGLKMAAAKAMDPIAKSRALAESGKIDMAAAPIISQIAMRKTMLSGMQNGKVSPERVVEMMIPEASRGAARKELQEAQNMSHARDNVLSAFDQLAQINTVGNRIGSPIQSSKQVEALKSVLPSLSKDTAGRYTESDAKALSAFLPAPGDDANTLSVKRQRAISLMNEKMNFPTLKAYGIDASTMGRYSGQSGQSAIPESAPVSGK